MVRTTAAGVLSESLPVSTVYLAEPCDALFPETVKETVVHVFLSAGMACDGAADFHGDTKTVHDNSDIDLPKALKCAGNYGNSKSYSF